MGEDRNQRGEILDQESLTKLYRRHFQGAMVRSGASLFMWLSAFITFSVGFLGTQQLSGISAAVLYLILINPPTLWVLKRFRRRQGLEIFSIFINTLEIIGYTAIIYFTGGPRALLLSPVYAAVITYVGAVGPPRLPFVVAALSGAALIFMTGLEHLGFLPMQDFLRQEPLPGRILAAQVFAVICVLFVVAFTASYTGSVMRKQRRKLRRQNVEMEISQSDLQTALVKARESDRLKSEFLANMSHELRTPLNHIIGFTELVLDTRVGELNPNQAEYLMDSLKGGKHLLSLITDLLDLSKVEAGKMELHLADVDLKALLRNTLEMFEENAREREIHCSMDLDGIPDGLRADEMKLRQIFYNLLSNAFKFVCDGGVVRLSARLTEHYVRDGLRRDDSSGLLIVERSGNGTAAEGMRLRKCIEIMISDTGVGIKKEDQEIIFRRFERAKHPSGKKYPGTGLGLALTRGLVELHGGRIWVESEGEGKGSAFHVLLRV